MPYGDVDRIAKLVPATIGITIEQALKDSHQLQAAYEADTTVRELVDTARKLEGLVRGAGVHAAGVVIAPKPLTELVPVSRSKNDEIVTAYDMKAVEKMGLLKMDFLGLTTLTVIDDCLKLIRRNQNVEVNMATVPLDDQTTYEHIFHKALTSGVFQFESGGMRDVLRRYRPTTVEDLTALNALYRPGPIQGGMIDDFIERKWGRRKVEYVLPELEVLLKETLGVIVYQEQVMQIANVLAGYSLGEADLLRRAMGKKNAEEMARQRERFAVGAAKNKHPKDKATHIFDQMEKFAGYGFNKSHSAAYALLAYHTAYLKTHYPVEFMAALLTSEISKPENVVKYISECREMEIAVEPPNVQVSDADFTPDGKVIRFGLTAIKNVGRNAIDSILAARAKLAEERQGGFTSLWEFCEQVDLRLLNKRVIESLIKAGALDSFGPRARLMAAVDKAMERAQKSQRDLAAGQSGLFGGLGAIFDEAPMNGAHGDDPLPNVPDWDENLRLQSEKEVLGFFVSGHPMDKYADKIKNLKAVTTADAMEMKPAPPPARRGQQQPEHEIAVAGVIVGLKVAKSKRSGELYAQASLEDTVGKIDLIAFPKDYPRLAESLKIDVPVLVRGQLRAEEDAAPKLAVSSIQALEDVKVKLPQNVRIRVTLDRATDQTLLSLHAMIQEAPGPGKLMINLEQRGEFVVMLEPEGFTVGADRIFIERAEELLGRGAVQAID
jgi:DNA polymerase-3 subunit alpha